MIIRNFKLMSILILFLVLTLSSLSLTTAASSYSRSVPAYTFGQQTTPFIGGQLPSTFDKNMCQSRQDFILQVNPLGCTPSVIRSDLLEEQDVVVFCPIVATQLNPLIKIKDIDRLDITSRGLPREVLTVGYHPARAALGKFDPDIDTQFFGNVGYATIVLRQQKNESAMPDFVEGNLTARIFYDIDNAFGTGRSVYYLPQLTQEEWERDFTAYSFWDGRGYLRLEGSDNEGATIGVYSDRDVSGTGRLGEKTKITTLNLEKGGKPQEVFLPGFNYCMGGLGVQLTDLENPDTRARLRVDAQTLEVKEGEKFLENKCEVRSITKYGINQNVKISCSEDGKKNTFSLTVNPKVNLDIGGTTKEYDVGDLLYKKSGDLDKSVYLVYIGTTGDTTDENKLFIVTAAVPGNKAKLSEGELNSIAGFVSRLPSSKTKNLATLATNVFKFFASVGEGALRGIIEGQEFRYIDFGETKDIFGTNVKLIGFSGPSDLDISSFSNDVRDNYTKAMEDYETIKESFASEKYPPSNAITVGEQSLSEAIRLAEHLGQRKTASQLCVEFSDTYDSVAPQVCNQYILSNTQTSSQSVLINGRTHVISFERAREPRFEEFGAKILVQDANGRPIGEGSFELSKNQIITLDDSTGETIELLGLDANSAKLRVNLNKGLAGTIGQFVRDTKTIEIGTPNDFGGKYLFTLQEVNLQKVAKVSLNPQVDYARSNATFSFKIGIEKRGIQLSPEKTKERINNLNETIEKWTKISDGLGKVVEVGKAACLATGAALTIKNFFSNLGGKGIARQQVMRADGVGWYDKCKEMVKPKGQYDSVEACLFDKSDEIESSVNAYDAAMNRQNQDRQQREQGISSTKFLGEKVVDTDASAKKLIDDPNFRTEISSNLQGVFTEVTVGNSNVNVADIISKINSNTLTLSQAENLQLNSRLLDSGDETVKAIARAQVEKTLGEISLNSANDESRRSFIEELGRVSGFNGVGVGVYAPANSISATYSGGKTTQQVGDIPASVLIEGIIYGNVKYYLQLEKIGTEKYQVVEIYDESKKRLEHTTVYDEIKNRFVFTSFDSTSYQNPYDNPLVRYYETDPYKGLPAVVPFDVKNGWYAAVKSNLPILGGLRSYDDSGRVSSFYVCNVGPNGREENIGGDDICRGFVPGANQAPDFPGLDPRESARKMDQAVQAIKQATDAYRSGVSSVTLRISGLPSQSIKVGEPAANIPNIQCEDFMSPTDCNLLFNVCDPVVCPSSRCDLGGAYPVKDVIQSGIVGSLALCLPNWPEIKVPICVSGVHAGLEGYLSVLNSYQQCLQTSLDTGATVGICDEVNSVYMCEFFWRQGLPLAKYVIPKVIGGVIGSVSGNHGGGEYLGVQSALDNAGKSIDYFSQYYATNSFSAFKARSAEAVGGEICKNWVSISGPKGNLFDALTAPDSPSQFYGRFEEIPYTTATNPPVSQYKVFYHIYAGKDVPAYYQVYLRGTPGSFFQDTNSPRQVASDFIPAGNFKSETKDFTAPSGYKELCIVVNGQEECGFKQVTTEFGINYLSEQYVAQQASQTDIKSEAECVSGSPSTFSFINPNIQAGAEEALNPTIYNRGIIRVCSTDNPGASTGPARWKEVGNCGSENLKCWLDADSVKNVVRNANVEGQILGEVENSVQQALQQEGQYMDNDAFASFKKQIDELEGKDSEIINLITGNIEKAFYNNQKSYLHFRRGNAYGNLARIAYNIFIERQKTATTEEEGTVIPGIGAQSSAGQKNQIGVNYPVLEFNDGTMASDISYSYSGGDWYWSTDKENWHESELANAAGAQSGQDATGVKIIPDLSEKNKQFIPSLSGRSYPAGLAVLMTKTTQNQEEGILGFLPCFTGVCTELSTESVSYSYNGRFKVNVRGRVYWFVEYDKDQKIWRWSFDEKTWKNVPEKLTDRDDVVNAIGTETIQEINDIITSLNGKIFYDGAQIIFGIDAENFKLGEDTGSSTTVCSTPEECQIDSTNSLVLSAFEELKKWDYGKLNECDSAAKPLLEKYWTSVKKTNPDCNDDAWSAVFISYVTEQAGVAFPDTASHALNFKLIRENPTKYNCRVHSMEESNLIKVGDILFSCRKNNGQGDCPVSFANVGEGVYGHSMVVVAKDSTNVKTIGGNEGNTVQLKVRSIKEELLSKTFDPDTNNKYYYGFVSCNS